LDNKARIISLDYLKYIACFLVVNIHMELPKILDVLMSPLMKTAVPIFFMITGFFYTQTCNSGRSLKQIKKIAILALLANMLHIGWTVFKHLLNGSSLIEYLQKCLAPSNLVNLLFFNQPLWRISIWYINALLYVLIFIFLIQKIGFKKLDKLHWAIPLLLVGNLIFGTYAPLLFSESFELCYSRNFLFCGLPYFLAGYCLYHFRFKVKRYVVIIILVVCYLTSQAEIALLHFNNLLLHQDHLISTFFLSISLFMLFVQNNERFAGIKHSLIAELGRTCSFTIYITHSIIIEILAKIVAKANGYVVGVDRIYLWIGPIAVLLCSALIGYLWNKIKKFYNRQRVINIKKFQEENQ